MYLRNLSTIAIRKICLIAESMLEHFTCKTVLNLLNIIIREFIIMKRLLIISIFILMLPLNSMYSAEVYLVLGSDTAIWDAMDTQQYSCTYNGQLYTNQSMNGYGVMDPDFRTKLVDSYGTPLKLTWWMMAGNIFRYATNNDIPIPNIMTMYLMKSYHGDMIELWGDELSLHYHTFLWSDYDGDGLYFWNQSVSFLECRDDFDYTLCQFLLEENVFPVSFRSGWHFMDNDWQHYLNELLPYSMHNASPYHGIDTEEPLDNNYDWSQGPRAFVPYHASTENYQVPGDGKGWNVRSIHFGDAINRNILDDIFRQASFGFDQVACIWGHLPETDFLTNIQKIDQLSQQAAAKYPNVNFRYCTAIEAMQLWQQTNDVIPPVLTIDYNNTGTYVDLLVQVDEPIFQSKPFVACKDLYENYFIPKLTRIGDNQWRIAESIETRYLAKIGVSVCDIVGNQTNRLITIVPDDQFIDNSDDGYIELHGDWRTQSAFAWGTNSRIASVQDSVIVRWSFDVPQTRLYNAFIQFPEIDEPVDQMIIELHCGRTIVDTVHLSGDIVPRRWIYCGSGELIQGSKASIELKSYDIGSNIAADAVKFSAYVRDYDLYIGQETIDFGDVSMDDTLTQQLWLTNYGSNDLIIDRIYTLFDKIWIPVDFPVSITAMKSQSIPIMFSSDMVEIYQDTLFIESNDPNEPLAKLFVSANVKNHFYLVDNEDLMRYREFGDWYYSVAYGHGGTSRYSFLNQNPAAYAVYHVTLPRTGVYEFFEIVPQTSNSTNDAIYRIDIAGIFIDTLHVDQNSGSGDWVSLGKYNIRAGDDVSVMIYNSGKHTAGDVLRADALRFSLIQEMTGVAHDDELSVPDHFFIRQNYPNPFNPSTTISYHLPEAGEITIRIFNIRGEAVREIKDVYYPAGSNLFTWNGLDMFGREAASGVYLFTIRYGNETAAIKMLKLH